ncbi:MAG: TIGR00266 family protein [Oscillospiraceae bacterium]|nr:TIGR00266 family protein [Oscillospiraceae bacterium]
MQYRIEGETLPVVVCELEIGEKMITEGGSMAWMSPNMKMETTTNGGLGKALGRMFSGEKMFQNIYTATNGSGLIAFASSFPGSIKAFEISAGNEMIFQKRAFLAGESSVKLDIFFNKKVSGGLFGGEGFILQRVSGNGIAFAEFDGHVVEYDLAAGQRIVVSSGHLAAMTATCTMEVQTVSGAKNIFFGGEGIFNTVICGPGKVWLQTMPVEKVANSLLPFLPGTGSGISLDFD